MMSCFIWSAAPVSAQETICNKDCECLSKQAVRQCVQDAKTLDAQNPSYEKVVKAGNQAVAQARESKGAEKQAVRDRDAERKLSDKRLAENVKLKTEVVWWQRATVVGVVVGVLAGAAGVWAALSR